MTSEATARYLESVGEDCASVLGPGIAVISVDQEDLGGAVRLMVRYDVRGTVQETVAVAETIVAAHAALRLNLVRVRLASDFTALVSRK